MAGNRHTSRWHPAGGRRLRTRIWMFPLSIAILLAVSIGVFFVGQATLTSPVPPQHAGSVLNGAPAEVPGEATPAEHAGSERPGPLQVGVNPASATRTLELGTARQIPAYDRDFFEVGRHDVIRLRFANDSEPQFGYRFNFVLVKPGTQGEVQILADRAGPAQDFIPKTPAVLAHTGLVPPGESATIVFRAPSEPGDYPFICSFPGQGKVMHGTLRVS